MLFCEAVSWGAEGNDCGMGGNCQNGVGMIGNEGLDVCDGIRNGGLLHVGWAQCPVARLALLDVLCARRVCMSACASGNASIMPGTCCKSSGSARIGTGGMEMLHRGILGNTKCQSAGTCTVVVMSAWATSECSGLGRNVCAICSGPSSNVGAL